MADYKTSIGDEAKFNNNRWAAVTSCHFKVVIDDEIPLGSFTKCEGLAVEVSVETREEGGNNTYVHKLPGRVKYPNIKLTRHVNAHSGAVPWLFDTVNEKLDRTATITALAPDDATEIAEWTLQNVLLVKWTGPSFTNDSATALTETLEIAHHGFGPKQT